MHVDFFLNTAVNFRKWVSYILIDRGSNPCLTISCSQSYSSISMNSRRRYTVHVQKCWHQKCWQINLCSTLCSNVLTFFRASEIENCIFLYFASSSSTKFPSNFARTTLSTYCDFSPILYGSLLKISKILVLFWKSNTFEHWLQLSFKQRIYSVPVFEFFNFNFRIKLTTAIWQWPFLTYIGGFTNCTIRSQKSG